MPTLSPEALEQIRAIAETELDIETLKIQNSDRLDFHNLAVWSIRNALKAAYLAGMVDHHRSAKTEAPVEQPKTPIEQGLTAYLGGYTRNNPTVRAHIIDYPDWQRMARLELDRRAARLLEGLPDEEVRAVAEGQVSLPDLVKGLSD
jgi:hypothetical protein